MKNNKSRQILLGAGSLSALGVPAVFAQQFPSRPIKIIVPASPGTAIDATARFFTEPLSRRLNTPVLVDNRSGAGGLLGYTGAANSPADGYTIILTGIPLYLLPLSDERVAPYDPIKDFAPVARVLRVPLAVVVSNESTYQSLPQLIDAMKKTPDLVTYSSQGIGSTAHLCSVVLNDASGTKGKHISYKATSSAITDVAAARIDFTCQTPAGVLPLLQAKKLRVLAVTGSSRWEAMPDIPTAAETGLKDFEVSSQLDFMAPTNTPASVLELLSNEICSIARTEQFKEFCNKQIMTVEVVGHKELLPEMVRENVRWKRIVELSRGV